MNNSIKTIGNIRSSWGILDVASLQDFAVEDGVKGDVEFYQLPISFQLLSYSDGAMSWILPKEYLVNRYCDVVEIGTHSSRMFRCALDSPIIIVDENLNFKKGLPKKGLSVPRYTLGHNGNMHGQVITIPFRDQGEFKYVWKDSLMLDYNLGWLIGIYIGDGWTDLKSSSYKVNLANVNPDIVGKVKKIVSSYLLDGEVTFLRQKNPHYFRGKRSYSEKLIFSSKSWAKFFEANIGQLAANKHLPEIWQISDEDFRWGLLAGLIDSDGSISKCHPRAKPNPQIAVHYDTVSDTLSQEVVELAHSLGLLCTITYAKTPLGENAFVVSFNKNSIAIMSHKLVLKTRKYMDILAGFDMGKNKNVHIYSPVISKERLKQLRMAVGFIDRYQNKDKLRNIANANLEKIKERNRLYSAISRVIGGRDGCRGALIRDTAREIVRLDLSIFNEDNFWKRWKILVLDMDFSYEIITYVNPLPGKKPTYGFDIPDSHAIVTGSGFLL